MTNDRKRRGLSPKDQALFDKAMADVKPIKAKDQVALDVPSVPVPGADDKPLPFSWHAGKGAVPAVQLKHPVLDQQDLNVRADVPSPRDKIDRKARRGLAKGHQTIDRTIDLHGLNQTDAFAVLVRTIERVI